MWDGGSLQECPTLHKWETDQESFLLQGLQTVTNSFHTLFHRRLIATPALGVRCSHVHKDLQAA